MIKSRRSYIKRYITGILLSLFSGFLFLNAAAAPQSTSYISDQHLLGEKIFLHTDRDIFIAGEQIWFTVYLLNDDNKLAFEGSRIAYLEVLDNGNNVLAQTETIINNGSGNGEITIPLTATTGDYQIRAYTTYQRNWGPESFYYHYIKIFNPFEDLENESHSNSDTQPRRNNIGPDNHESNGITIEFDKEYKIREKVTIKIILDSDQLITPDSSNLSLSVSVPSRLKSNCDIESYISEQKPVKTQGTNNLRFRREIKWTNLYGKFLEKEDLSAVRSSTLYLSFPGQFSWLYYAKTDNNGDFIFKIPIDYGDCDLLIQPSFKNSDEYLIRITPSYSDKFIAVRDNPFRADSQLISDATHWSINYQVGKAYASRRQERSSTVRLLFNDNFYGIPDKRLLMEEYVELPVMEEVFYELISGVTLKEERSGFKFSITDNFTGQKFENPPAVFLDGLFIHDAAIIGNLDPEIVEKVDVIRETYQLGDLVFEGLIGIKTKNWQSSDINPGNSSVRVKYSPFDIPDAFTSVTYDEVRQINNRTPDLRNTLYWVSSVSFNKDGIAIVEFYTSDFTSDYEIRIEGINGKGEPVSLSGILTVTK